MVVLQPGKVNGTSIGGNKLTYNDDIAMGWNGVGSQIDGFGHIGTEGVLRTVQWVVGRVCGVFLTEYSAVCGVPKPGAGSFI